MGATTRGPGTALSGMDVSPRCAFYGRGRCRGGIPWGSPVMTRSSSPPWAVLRGLPASTTAPVRSRACRPAMSILERGMHWTETPYEAKSLRGYLTAGQLAAVLAAGIHAAVVPEHLQESLLIGGFFVVVALGQFGLAAALRQRPPVLLVVGAIWAHVGLIALYVA